MRLSAAAACILILAFSCSKAVQTVKITEPEPLPAQPENHSFGPFFWPENHSLSAVSINFFTEKPVETRVQFSMVGDIDWERQDREPVMAHRMKFNGLEESAVYQFLIKTGDGEDWPVSSISTLPYGNDYAFRFLIASRNADIDPDTRPSFLVLTSERTNVTEEEIRIFCRRNRKLLSATVFLPLFDFTAGGQSYELSKSGFFFGRFRNLNLILLYREQTDYQFISKFVNDGPDDQNVIVVSGLSPRSVRTIARMYSLLNCRVYTTDPLAAGENVVVVDGTQTVTVIKKPSYALFLTNAGI